MFQKIGCLLIIQLLSFNFLFSQNQIVGKWQNETKTITVQVYESGGKYFGKIISLKEGQYKKDKNNPDPKKRKNNLIGLVVVKNLEYKNGEWINGTVYNPNSGDSYECKLWLKKDNNTLMGRGYYGIVYKTQEWKRVN
jgi:uncharacterized protein (DUF2147 family)